MKRQYRKAGIARVASATLAMLAVTCGFSSFSAGASTASTSVPGITKTTIDIGHIADISGPIPGLMLGSQQGIQAWAAYVNSTGGIDGRKIVLKDQDSALSCTDFTNEIASIAKSDFAMVGSASAADSCGLTTLQANPDFADIVAFFVASNYTTLPNVFVPSPQPPGWRNAAYVWVKGKYGAAATKKYAALYSSVTAASFQYQLHAANSVGYKLLYSRGVGLTESNFTADILRMKTDGVEVVDLSTLSDTQVADFEQQAVQQGFHPDAVVSFAYDNSFTKLIGTTPDANNMVMPLDFAMFLGTDAKTVPEITTMTKWLHKTNPSAEMSIYVAETWGAGLMFQQAMEKLGSNPTQAGLLKALGAEHSFDGNGLYPSLDAGRKIANPCVVIAGVKNGKFVRIDPAKSGFECNGKYVVGTSSAS